MEDLFVPSWRAIAGVPLALAGAVLLGRGLRTFVAARAEKQDPARALAVARSLRSAIAGLCLIVLASGLAFDLGWLAILALIVLGEEMLETSVMVAALEDGRRRASAQR